MKKQKVFIHLELLPDKTIILDSEGDEEELVGILAQIMLDNDSFAELIFHALMHYSGVKAGLAAAEEEEVGKERISN